MTEDVYGKGFSKASEWGLSVDNRIKEKEEYCKGEPKQNCEDQKKTCFKRKLPEK